MILLAGYGLVMLMGLILGLMGAGGTILTIPIFVYFLDVKPMLATSYSLIVVGSAALIGAIVYWRNQQLRIAMAVTFALPAMVAVWLTRAVIVPSLPTMWAGFSKDSWTLLVFSCLALLAAGFMLKPRAQQQRVQHHAVDGVFYLKLIIVSIGVGFLTGLIGAGGGFLIIPSLMGFFKLNVKEAVGTSLAIIAMNSLAGISGDITAGITLDWVRLALVLGMTLVGMKLGVGLGKPLPEDQLRYLFGFVTLFIGMVILAHEAVQIFIS